MFPLFINQISTSGFSPFPTGLLLPVSHRVTGVRFGHDTGKAVSEANTGRLGGQEEWSRIQTMRKWTLFQNDQVPAVSSLLRSAQSPKLPGNGVEPKNFTFHCSIYAQLTDMYHFFKSHNTITTSNKIN